MTEVTRILSKIEQGDPSAAEQLQPCDRPDRMGKAGSYEVIEVVGHGGMGTAVRAWSARGTKLHRIVVLKVLSRGPFIASLTSGNSSLC